LLIREQRCRLLIWRDKFESQSLKERKVSLWCNCRRSLKFNIPCMWSDHKICIYTENGWFPKFFET
jgi:hypothetical protein